MVALCGQDEALRKLQASNSRGFVVQVYKGEEVSILTPYRPLCQTKEQVAFYEGGTAFNTASETYEEAMRRSVEESSDVSLHYFENLTELAEAVIANSWR